jgi:hypothetical protein
MPKGNPNPKIENLKPFAKGHDPRRNMLGAPRKFISNIKSSGYAHSEITDCLLVLLSMTIEELKQVHDNPEATVLEKTVANALVTSYKKGSLYSVETLLSRAIGTPKQTTDMVLQTSIRIEAPDNDTKTAIENI